MSDYERGLIVGVLLGLRLACVVFGRSFNGEIGGW